MNLSISISRGFRPNSGQNWKHRSAQSAPLRICLRCTSAVNSSHSSPWQPIKSTSRPLQNWNLPYFRATPQVRFKARIHLSTVTAFFQPHPSISITASRDLFGSANKMKERTEAKDFSFEHQIRSLTNVSSVKQPRRRFWSSTSPGETRRRIHSRTVTVNVEVYSTRGHFSSSGSGPGESRESRKKWHSRDAARSIGISVH